ncbi:MarR family winged helix-turn-helix transcriptional regulator [Streptomyces sp. NPDC050145]|uniref:MarR family winged helix-turn-helix transcriptional regulator n=1 Tax=Streptomyces sp. NPDC050145 TaxID=3365602 RepID=UPI0037BB8908
MSRSPHDPADAGQLADTRLEPDARLGALARRLAVIVSDRVQGDLTAEGLTDLRPVHLRIFAALGQGEGARVTGIAERLGSTKQTVGPLVDELVAKGYLHRRRDPADARAKIVDFTPAGRAAAEAARRSAERVDRQWADRIGDRRLAECRATLWELVNASDDPANRP